MKTDGKILETGIMFYLPMALKEKINNQAHDERLSRSEFIRKVLSDYIKEKKANNDFDVYFKSVNELYSLGYSKEFVSDIIEMYSSKKQLPTLPENSKILFKSIFHAIDTARE